MEREGLLHPRPLDTLWAWYLMEGHMEQDIAAIQQEIDATRKLYHARKAELERLASEHGAPQGFSLQVIERLGELGVEDTLESITDYPGLYDLPDRTNSQALANQLRPVTEKLLDTDLQLDVLITIREDKLTEQNPEHKRAMHMLGREFTLDMEKGTINYLDEPGIERSVEIEKVVPDREQVHSRNRKRARSL